VAVAGVALAFAAGAPEVGASVTPPTYVATIGGGLGGHAQIYPGGVDVDPSGNIYIADTGNDDVMAYSAAGTPLWGGPKGQRGAHALGNFDNPRDIAYQAGLLYVADLGNKRVQVLSAATGNPISPQPGQWASDVFPSPIGISAGVDGSGNPIILVTQDVKNQVTAYNSNGVQVGHFGTGTSGSGNGQLAAPRDAATNAAGDVYVADYGNDRIEEFSPSGAYITQWGTSGGGQSQFRRPYGVAVDVDGKVYVADSTNHRVQIFDGSGQFIAQYGQAPASPDVAPTIGQFAMLRRVAVQPGVHHPDIYLADLWGYRLSQVSQDASSPPNFTFDRVFGNVPPQDGKFNEPSGLTFDTSGNLYVADAVNQRMEVFDASTYAYIRKWGERGWGTNDEGFNWPRDLSYVPATNTIWVADTKNGRLIEFNTDGTPTGRKVGSIGAGANQFNRPYAIETYGNTASVIVADSFNNRIERWDVSSTATFTAPMWSTSLGNSNPQDVTVDPTVLSNGQPTVLATDTRNNRLIRLDGTNGAQVGGFLDAGGGTQGLHSPEGVDVDSSGNIWVGDRAFNRIVELSSAGAFLQSFGKLGTSNSQFNHPTHLVIVGGLLYVCDVYNDRIQVYNIDPVQGSVTDTFTGHVDTSGTVSLKFPFTVGDTNAPITATLTWTTGSANLNAFLTPPGTSTAVAQTTTSAPQPKTVTFQPTVTGSWSVRVKAVSGASDFTIKVTHD
jgi:sugar lactone lactonase YvrE